MASKAVNVPTNTKIKEKDVNAKLQLYGIYAAFANGKVPSNKQIDVAMNSALEWHGLKNPSKKLSSDGQLLVADLRDVIEKAKLLLLAKNEGNLLQDFIWQTQHIGAGDATLPNAPLDKDTAKQHGNQALEGLRTLGQLIITNGQFRKLLSDASILVRDVAGDAAQNAANKVNPTEEQLSQIDQPADDNTWHEAPNFSKDNIKSQLQSRVPISKKDVDEVKADATHAAAGTTDPTVAADRAAQDQDAVDPVAGGNVAASNVKSKIDGRISEDQKEKMRAYRERANNYFKGKMPKERREQIIWRLKKMIVEIQGHQDYQQAIDTLLRLAEQYAGHARNVADQSQGSVKGAHSQDSLKAAETDLKTLLERFANGTSFADVKDSIDQLYRDADRDPELRNWFKSLDRFLRRCLQDQGYVLQDASNEEWNKLYDHGNFLLRERYRHHTDRIADEFKFVADQFDKDPQNKAFGDSMNKLFTDLGNDQNGQPTFKPHLVKDLTEVILPSFFEHIRYVPIPRIEYSDRMVDAVVENLVIEGDNLAPNVLEFGSDNYWRWGRKSIQNKNKNKIMLSVSGVQMDLRDVSYYIKKKEGFPGVTDKGVMDIFLGGSGLSFKVAMETADKTDKARFFKINTVNVDVKNVNIKLKQSNHKLLFAMFKPLLLKVMRPVLQKVVEKQIRDSIRDLDALFFRVKSEVDRAEAEIKANPDPENVQNIYQRYFNAFQKEMQKANQKKEEVKAKTEDKKVNVAVTQKDSIFKNISLPGGISTKATEYKELAAKGDKWESPVFSIGSASETSSLPSATSVTRKSNRTTASDQPLANGNTAFANQVNSAFQPDAQAHLNLSSGTTGLDGTVGGAANATGPDPHNTTLGRSNPVLQGSV